MLLLESEPTSDLLRQAVQETYRSLRGDHPRMLARVFQAIRMQINQELSEIQTGLKAAVTSLVKGGRVCVLSYHSVEDREVKETFRSFEKACICSARLPVCCCGGNHRVLKKLTPRPLEPSPSERDKNSRARSAKLRVMEKI